MPHTSDLEILVETKSFEELVKESILAMTEVVADEVTGEEKRHLEAKGTPQERLMRILEETVYLQSAELFYVREVEMHGDKVELTGGRAKARGEIKAVTWHDFWVKPGWKAHFICDL